MAKFPENFLWGASSSSAQIEGGYMMKEEEDYPFGM